MTHFIRTLFVTIMLTSLTGHVSALTIEEIENKWANVGKTTATFVQRNPDGSTETGVLTTNGPSRVKLTLTSGKNAGSSIRTNAGAFILDDKKGQPQTFPMGGLKFLFRPKVNLQKGAVARIGEAGGNTYIIVVDTTGEVQGHAKIFFNQSGQMVKWEMTDAYGDTTTTVFTYQ